MIRSPKVWMAAMTAARKGESEGFAFGYVVRFGEREGIEVRFIELMPTSGLSPECKELGAWRPALFVKGGLDIRRALREEKAGPVEIEALLRGALETKKTWDRGDLEGLQSDMFKVGG